MILEQRTTPSKQLTIDEFLDQLGKIRDSFEWSFEADVRPGSERRAWPRFWIWGTTRIGTEAVKLDPIGAVCFALTGRHERWKLAARVIGLSSVDADAIAAAATDRTWREIGGRRRPDEYLQSLRVKLLEQIGDSINIC